MEKLVETKLQKFTLLVGGLLIFFKLIGVGYYERYNAILTSIGIFVLTVVLLILLRGYHPKFHLKIAEFVKRHRQFFKYFIILAILTILVLGGSILNREIKEGRAAKIVNEKFHNAEIAYQRCLDKVANQRIGGRVYNKLYRGNSYFDEWVTAGRPNYDMQRGHWEWSFMEWMVGKYPEFCKEYDIDLINYFLEEKEVMISGLPNRFDF